MVGSLPRGMPTVVDESVEVRVRKPNGGTERNHTVVDESVEVCVRELDGGIERKRQRLDSFRPSV